MLALHRSEANARNVRFSISIRVANSHLSTQLIKPNYLVITLHRRNTTVPLETFPLYFKRYCKHVHKTKWYSGLKWILVLIASSENLGEIAPVDIQANVSDSQTERLL